MKTFYSFPGASSRSFRQPGSPKMLPSRLKPQTAGILKKGFVVTLLLVACLFGGNRAFSQGSWSTLTNYAPHANGGVMLLLTDGSIMCKSKGGGSGQGTIWDILTPNASGSYLNGTWTSTAAMNDDRLYFSSQVLRDGRVYVAGGEYGSGGHKAEYYNKLTNTWTACPQINYVSSPQGISDANSELLPDGRVLQNVVDSYYSGYARVNYIWDPATNTYANAPACLRTTNEAPWLKLPDNSILFVDNYGTTSERYIPASNTFINDANVPVSLFDPYGEEAGAAFLLPDGRGFFLGSTGHTAFYTPSGSTANGSWAAGPDIPGSQGTPDAPAVMMPNGKILCAVSPLPTSGDHFPDSTRFYEFDYTTNTFTLVSTPIGGTQMNGFPTFIDNMLVLPDGNVLFSIQGNTPYFLYTPSGSPLTGGKPAVSNVYAVNCDTFTAVGTQFNGISEGSCYGDDWQNASNYPVIRLTNGSNVYYTRTYNWNSTGVNRGSAADTVKFILPAGLPAATYSLQVIANGIPSSTYSFNSALTITPASATVCVGSTTTLTSSWSGGSWSSSNPALGSVSTGGVVTGVSAGVVNITYTSGTCFATVPVTVSPLPAGISGTLSACIGLTTTLTSSTSGGYWTSSNGAVATVGTSTGVVTGVTAGVSNITYTVGSCYTTAQVTITTTPPAITGTATVCVGGNTYLSDSASGGTWSSSDPSLATINTYGVVTGMAAGTVNISYTTGSCYSVLSVTVLPSPSAISGPSSVCVGSTITLTDTTSGGTWSSVTTPVATVGSLTGIVTGVSVSGTTIHYTIGNGCFASHIVTVLSGAGSISGTLSACAGQTSTLSAFGGGTWTSSNPGIASVTGSTGVVTGNATGVANITYTVSSGCYTVAAFTVNASPSPIMGANTVCVGATTTLSDATGGGTWTSSNATLATVGAATGIVTGMAAGAPNITYQLGSGCFTVYPVTVNPLPASITGTSNVCIGATTTLSSTPGGGLWTSSNTGLATIAGSTGLLMGVSAGSLNITYTLGSGCFTTYPVTVNPLPSVGTISGANSVCVGSTTALLDSPGFYLWSTSNATIATVSTTGVVTGVASGVATISYSATSGAGCTATVTHPITVNPLPSVGTISGANSVCVGSTTALLDSPGFYLWSTSNATIATVSTTGVVTGVASGVATISYSATSGAGCTATVTHPITVNPLPYAGTISGADSLCVGATTTYLDSPAGYAWSSSNTAIATVSSTGVVTAIASGVANISYTVTSGAGCIVIHNKPIIVHDLISAGIISGSSTVAVGLTTNLYDAASGGVWGASNGNATVSGGLVTGVSLGMDTISYSITNACGTSFATAVVTVVSGGLSSITGTFSVCTGMTTTMSNTTGGGTWTTSDGSIATISSSGVVDGVSPGVVTITYTVLTDSVTAQVTVNPLPSPITGTAYVCQGSTITLSDTTWGGSWSSGSTGTATVGSATGLVYGITPGTVTITYALPTGCYTTSVVVINSLPNTSAFSLPSATAVCQGNSSLVNVSSSSLGSGTYTVTYNLSGANSATGLTASLTIASAAGTFSVPSGHLNNAGSTAVTVTSVLNAAGCSKALTTGNTVTIAVNALPTAYTVSGGGFYCTGGTGVSVGLSGSQAGVSYQLYYNGVASGSPMSGTGAAISFGLRTAAGTYTVMAANSTTGCNNTMTGSVTITINSLPTAYSVTGGGAYCSGGTGVHVGLSGSQTGVNYQLYRGATADGSPMAGTGSALDFGLKTTAATYTVVATSATGGCTGTMTGNAIVTISPAPIGQYMTGGGTFCAGGVGFHVGLSGSQSGYSYQLFRNGTSVGTPLPGTGSGLDWGYQTISGTYTAVASASGSCPVNMYGTAIITANPSPTVYSVTGGGSYCPSGSGVHIGLSGSQSGINYQLYRGTSLIGYPVAGTGAALDFGLQSTVGTYTVVATAATGGCTANMSGSAVVSVSTSPTVYAVTGGGSYCTGVTGPHVGLTGSAIGVNYQLYLGGVPVGSPVAGTGVSLDFGAQTASGTYTVVATNAGSSCTSNMSGSAVITVNSIPTTYSVTGGGSICSGYPGVNVGLSGSAVTVTYYLYRNGVSIGSAAGTGSPINYGPYTVAGTYTVVALSTLTGCTSNQTGSAVISVVAPPSAGTISGPTVVHNGGTITLVDAAPGGTWSASNSHVTISPLGVVTGVSAGVVYITYSVSNGTCTANALYPITEAGPTPPPAAGSISGNTQICVGGTTTLSNTAKGGVWSSADNGVATVDAASGVVKGLAQGIAVITYTVGEGQAAVATYAPVQVLGAPDAVAISAVPGTTVEPGQKVTFTANVSNGVTAEKYQWFINGNIANGYVGDVFVTATLNDGDVVRCEAIGECGTPVVNSVQMSVIKPVVLTGIDAYGNISVLPNPNNGLFTVKGIVGHDGNDVAVTLIVHDELGRVVKNVNAVAAKGNLDEVIQLDRSVASGMYLLTVHTDAGNKVFHIVVSQ